MEGELTDSKAIEWHIKGYDFCYETIRVDGKVERLHYKDHIIGNRLFRKYFNRDIKLPEIVRARIYELNGKGMKIVNNYEANSDQLPLFGRE